MDLGRYPTFLNVNRPKRKVFKGWEHINDSKVFNLQNISNQNQKRNFSQCDKTLHPKYCDNTSRPLLLVLCLLQIVATIAAAPLFNYNLQWRRGGSSENQDRRTKRHVFQGYSSWISILQKRVHTYVQEQTFNIYNFWRVLSRTPGWFLLGPLEFKINDSAWQRAQKSTTALANANQTVTVSSDSENGATGDETKNILKAFKFQGVLCTATSCVVSCRIKNLCHIKLEILASCARVKCSVNLTFCY